MLDKLKDDTRPLHDKVEEAMESGKIMSDNFSREEYTRLLQKLYIAHSALEPALLSVPSIAGHPGIEASFRLNKLKALETDLKALGAQVPQTSMASPDFENPAEAWGALYVLEGSTLGGAMILKHLRGKLQWENSVMNFYGYYGKHTGSLWKEFKTSLHQVMDQYPNGYDALLEGANKAYSTFIEAATSMEKPAA